MCGSLIIRNDLNLQKCSTCDFIAVSRISVFGGEEEVDKDLMEMSLLCSELDIEDVAGAKKIMRSAYVQIQRGNYTNDELAVVSLYIHQRMNNRVVNLANLCEISGVKLRRAKTVLGRTEQFFNVNLTYNLDEAREFCEFNDYDVMEIVERVSEHIQITRYILAACVYMGTELSYYQVAKRFHMSKKSVINYNKKLEELI